MRIKEMFLRYPGSKAKLYRRILDEIPCDVTAPLYNHNLHTYCEPFFGSGAIGWRLIPFFRPRTTHVIMWDPLESTCRHASLSIL